MNRGTAATLLAGVAAAVVFGVGGCLPEGGPGIGERAEAFLRRVFREWRRPPG